MPGHGNKIEPKKGRLYSAMLLCRGVLVNPLMGWTAPLDRCCLPVSLPTSPAPASQRHKRRRFEFWKRTKGQKDTKRDGDVGINADQRTQNKSRVEWLRRKVTMMDACLLACLLPKIK